MFDFYFWQGTKANYGLNLMKYQYDGLVGPRKYIQIAAMICLFQPGYYLNAKDLRKMSTCIVGQIKKICLVLLIVLSFTGCGGGGETDSGGGTEHCDIGGVVIKEPTYEPIYSVSTPSIQLFGIAPLASYWNDCYPCVPSSTGVSVIWNNAATGDSDTAYSYVRTGWIFGYPIYTHDWIASISLSAGENPITVTAYEDGIRVGRTCIDVTYIPDTIEPSSPINLISSPVSPNRIDLSWGESTDNATTDDAGISYKIYRNDKYIKTVSDTVLSDIGLSPGTQYCYTVSAIDTSENESPQSPASCATTLDQSGPTVPTELGTIIIPTGGIGLSWTASSDDVGVAGYNIYRDGNYLDSSIITSYNDTATSPDTLHCYTVTAYDDIGNESDQSNESCTDTSWSVLTIDSAYGAGKYSCIAIDDHDNVHIGYYDDAGPDDLKYATNATGSWVIQTIDSGGDVGKYSSIAVDSAGHVHLSYYDYGEIDWQNDDVKHATNQTGIWVTEKVDEGGWFTSLAVDSQDYLHITYRNNGLKHATNSSGAWFDETVVMPDFWNSIAIDDADHLHISSYQGYPAYDLIYTTNASGNWVSESIDPEAMVGEFNDIALDSNGKVYISYYERFGALKYATNVSGSWQTYTIDSDGGLYTSLDIDAADKVHISYVNQNGFLKYASNESGTWKTVTIDRAVPLEGLYYAYLTSLAVDPLGDVHISYHGADSDLRYATNK